MLVERGQFLDANLESAKAMTVLGALLTDAGALKRADGLLRSALELFWRELKGPHPCVARCYKVCTRCAALLRAVPCCLHVRLLNAQGPGRPSRDARSRACCLPGPLHVLPAASRRSWAA